MTTVLLHSGAAAPKLETPRPQVKVVRGGNRGLNRARRFAQATLRTLALAIVLGLVISVLYSHAKLTELSGEINEVNTQLAAARSEWCSWMRFRSAATPGPKHFSSAKMRMERTGCRFCSIPLKAAEGVKFRAMPTEPFAGVRPRRKTDGTRSVRPL